MMSNLHSHAMTEFRAAQWINDKDEWSDDMQEAICKHVLKLLDVFTDEGHTGTTAPYTINVFKTLAMFEPLVPLTGEDWEWYDTGHNYQNKRASHVFKDYDSDRAYDINGKVFWEWSGTKDRQYKSHYTCRESRVYVEFPYSPTTEYVYRYSDATPPAPQQTEEGLL